ncbi:MAG: CAP domain-containing protein [Pseudomonadota bacterium]
MPRLVGAVLSLILFVAACTPADPVIVTTNGGQTQTVYRIKRGDTGDIQFRMLDSVNALRRAAGQPAVELDARLNAAAATHARDMSVQNRPWHFGSDGSSPIDRVRRVGYTGALVGENISETYETEIETLAAWMDQPDTRRTILSGDAREMGFAWYQETSGKIWWTLIMGNPSTQPLLPAPSPSAQNVQPGRV